MPKNPFFDQLYDHIGGITETSLPRDVINLTTRMIFDSLNCSILGAREQSIPDLAKFAETEHGPATLVGRSHTATAQFAAFFNSAMAQVYDANDGYRWAKAHGVAYHPGRIVIPVAMAIAEEHNLSGEQLIRGIVAGYEAALSIPSPVAEAYGAVWTIATMLELSKAEISHALGFAKAICASRVFVPDAEYQDHDILNVAYSSKVAFEAILFSKAGFKAYVLDDAETPNLLDVKDGNAQSTLSDLTHDYFAEAYKLRQCYIKSYPSCRATHAAVEAAVELKKEQTLNYAEVKEVIIELPQNAAYVKRQGMPAAIKARHFDVQYGVSCILLYGDFIPEYYHENSMGKADLDAVYQKTQVLINPELDQISIDQGRGAAVGIILENGETMRREVVLPKGEPEVPFSDTELIDKWARWHGSKISPEDLSTWWSLVQEIVAGRDVRKVLEQVNRQIVSPPS